MQGLQAQQQQQQQAINGGETGGSLDAENVSAATLAAGWGGGGKGGMGGHNEALAQLLGLTGYKGDGGVAHKVCGSAYGTVGTCLQWMWEMLPVFSFKSDVIC